MADLGAPVTWESLESYINSYTGIIKVKRLQHIASQFEVLKLPALLLALKTLEEDSLDTTTYEQISQLVLAADPSYQVNHAWIKEASRKADVLTEKLEQEIKAYKNNLIKESIRMGQQDISNHYIKTGNLEAALKALFRTRDYCTTVHHTFQVNMGIIGLSIFSGQWQQVLAYVAKNEPVIAQTEGLVLAPHQLNLAAGLAFLHQKEYRRAAEKLNAVGATIGTNLNSVVTMNDIANMTCLLALATYNREEILKLSESSSFKPFLELEVTSREALTAFHKSRYAECFRLLDVIKGNMQCDIFFGPHVDDIYSLIRERSILQFTSAFKLVSLQRMATTFALSIQVIEESLAALIAQDKLPNMRLNLQTMQLVDEGNDLRSEVFDRAAQMSSTYRDKVEQALFHLAVTKAGLGVEAPKIAKSISRPHRNDAYGGPSSARHARGLGMMDGNDEMMGYD